MKKICFHINSFMTGGIERVLLQQLKAFDKKEVELTLLITFHFPELEVLLPEIPQDVKVVYLLDKPYLNSTRQKKAVGKINPLMRIYDEVLQIPRSLCIQKRVNALAPKFDIIIDFDVTLGTYLKNVAAVKLGWFHFSVNNYHKRKASRLKRLGKKFEVYDKIVMISDQMKAEAEKMFPHLKSRFIRIYNGFDFKKLYDRANLTQELSPSAVRAMEKPYILASGRFDERQKDFSTLIKGFATASSSISQNLVIAGDGPDLLKLESLVKELNIQSRVFFVGFQSNPLPLVKQCDFFVHSSKFEGLPTVLIEALCFHKTVIASDCPTGPREILDNEKCGYLFSVGDSNKLTNLIVAISNGILPKIEAPVIDVHLVNFDIGKIQSELLQVASI